jgi:nucleotide-binding universal stress UspA family protein
MEPPPYKSILHPTDFSRRNECAFAHAVRLAAAAQSALHVLHVAEGSRPPDEDRFPKPSTLLTRWDMPVCAGGAAAPQWDADLKCVSAAVEADNVAQAIGSYAERHGCDMVVLMTNGLGRLGRYVKSSVAEASARFAGAPALFLRHDARGFVDEKSGKVRLRRVLMPVAADFSPMHAWGLASRIVRMLEPTAEFQLLHVGDALPNFGSLLPYVEVRRGPVVETILDVAREINPDLIVMATEGHADILDQLRGSTTERVLREAPCPVLAIPRKSRKRRS